MDGKPVERDILPLSPEAAADLAPPPAGATMPRTVAEGGTLVDGSALSAEQLEQMTADIIAALKTVYDPEIPSDIYELGLIYKIDIADDRHVTVDMTLTAPGCPVAGEMPTWVENAVCAVPGIQGSGWQVRIAGQAPLHPLNLVGDFGGGGMYLAFGVVCAMLEAQRSGKGQVVDAAMVDGSASLMAMFHGMFAEGIWREERGTNMLDSGAPWYDCYETKDGKWVSIGSIERRFYADLLQRLGLEGESLPKQHDRAGWPVLRARFTAIFKSRTRSEWEKAFEGSDACFAPVLSISEVTSHPHNAVRSTFVSPDGVQQPAPAPRFSRTRPEISASPRPAGSDTAAVLAAAGYSNAEIEKLLAAGVAGVA